MSNNYVFGRGELRFDQFEQTKFAQGIRQLLGERYLGNTTAVGLTIETESLDHMDGDHGINVLDDTVDTQINRTGTFACDNINGENVAMFYQGQVQNVTQTSTPVTGATVGPAVEGVTQGRYYQLGVTPSNPVGVRGVTSVTVAETSGPTTFDLTDDYTVDAEQGTIYIVEGGAIADGTVLDDVDYTPVANTREQVISGNAAIYGALRYKSFNPKGKNRDFYIPYCKITPNGEHAWKGDDWQVLNYNISILEPGDGQAAIYIDGRPVAS